MKSIAQMTLKEKIGQLVFAGFPSTSIDANLKTLISEYKLGNIVLFARNVENIEQLHNLNQTIYKEMLNEFGIIPLIAIDQEGGMVMRITSEATFWPGNMSVAATKTSQYAYELGKSSGEELRALGINMNLAPSLDINNNPLNPVIGVRSYGDHPKTVTDFGMQAILGLQSTGILATAKHFPGHGDTSTDSHYLLPVIPHDVKRLHEVELYPFKQAIKHQVKAIMSAHVFFTAYEDSSLPATLSKRVMHDLLRQELGYEGLIISDCMEMKAIDDTYTASKGALMGLLAGLDMVMVSATYAKQKRALELIEQAVLNGSFPEALLDEKVNRVLLAKEKLYPTMEEFFLKRSFVEKKQDIINLDHQKLAAKVVDLSFTKVKGEDFYPSDSLLVVAVEPFAQTVIEDVLSKRSIIDALKQAKLPYTGMKIKVNCDDEQIDLVVQEARKNHQVIVFTYNAWANKNQAKLVRRLNMVNRNLTVVSTRNPYDIFAFPQISNYYSLYEYTPNSVASAIAFIKGDLKATGTLPVSINQKMKIGASIYVGLEQSIEENIAYLQLLKQKNIDLVFISAHMPEMKNSFVQELNIMIETAKKLDLKIILDVSKPMMNQFLIPDIYSLRLDYGFGLEDIFALSQKYPFYIELNASTVKERDLQALQIMGMDMSRLRVSHNFYPKPFTGLDQETVAFKNAMFHRFGLHVMAYIPSHVGKRGPIYAGLPTVEDHRLLPLEAALSEMRLLSVDEVVFGDSFASFEELDLVNQFAFDELQIPILIDEQARPEEIQQLMLLHRCRTDANSFGVRSSTRLKDKTIEKRNTIVRKPFDVTIDNSLFARYAGEVTIIKKEQPSDERVNVVGKALISDYLLQHIKPGQKFRFIIKNQIEK